MSDENEDIFNLKKKVSLGNFSVQFWGVLNVLLGVLILTLFKTLEQIAL